jgi:hypothetical protein
MSVLSRFMDWSAFDGTTVLIERRPQSGLNSLGETVFTGTPTQLYDGPANVYDKTSTIIIATVGEIPDEEIVVIIDPTTSGWLPSVQEGDRIKIETGPDILVTYFVTRDHVWDMAPFSLELRASSSKAW